MRHRRLISLASLFAATVVCGLTACAAEDAPEPIREAAPRAVRNLDAPSRADEPAPPDTTLATLRLSETHTVRFTESADGDLEIYEKFHADRDRGARSVADLETDNHTLANVHRYLLPDQRVPDILLEADARAAQRIPGPAGPEPAEDGFSLTDAESRAAESPGVNWDWAADATWFRNHYYTGGSAGFFAANVTWAHQTKKRYTNWYKASAFNQSFESGAHYRVDRSRKCGFLGASTCWDTKVDDDIGNRQVWVYEGTGNKYRRAWMDGYGATARIGLAVRWDLSGQVGGGPNAPACGAHNQLACSSGARCQPGLKEYNGACWGCGTRNQSCCKDWGPIPTSGGWQGSCAEGICGYPDGYCH